MPLILGYDRRIHGFCIFHLAMPFGNYCIPLKHKFLRLQGQKIAIGYKKSVSYSFNSNSVNKLGT